MHPAPSLAEVPPKSEEPRTALNRPMSPTEVASQHTPSASPPARKDTNSSIVTTATSASAATVKTDGSAATSYSSESSPTYTSQAIFSIKDGPDSAGSRRANRRRTGPLSAEQREKAALIRKLGACGDCRRRRVACNPLHHNMTWEDAVRKYRSHSPNSLQDLPPLAGRPPSPAPLSHHRFTHDPQEMDIDSTPNHHHPGRAPLSEARIRTPLPSGPRLEKTAAAAIALPGIESLKTDLQGAAARVLSSPSRSRYAAAHVLLLYWQDDGDDLSVRTAVDELREVLERHYHYTFEISAIPSSSDECRSSWRWLSRKINDFVDDRDQRDVLKLVYYNGHSYLDGNRDMVLASSKNPQAASTIRWSGIQQILEEAVSDILIVMDAAYFPSSKMARQHGVLEIVAAAASEDHARLLDRGAFTRALAEQLRTRAAQHFMSPLTAAELHARLLSAYPKMIQDQQPEREALSSFPCPLHMQMAGNARLPSIQLAPTQRSPSLPFGTAGLDATGPQVTMTLRLTDDALNMEAWTEWLRMMPEGIKGLKVEGPYRTPTFR